MYYAKDNSDLVIKDGGDYYGGYGYGEYGYDYYPDLYKSRKAGTVYAKDRKSSGDSYESSSYIKDASHSNHNVEYLNANDKYKKIKDKDNYYKPVYDPYYEEYD